MPDLTYAAPNPAPSISQDPHAAALLDVHQVATLLRCSPRHVHRMARAQLMPAPVHLGAALRWNRDTLLEWITSGCPAAGSASDAVSAAS